jgi:PAS domain S-box-containing protein
MRNAEARDMGRNIDLFGKRKDGTIIPLEISLSLVQVDSKIVVTALVRDISKKRCPSWP